MPDTKEAVPVEEKVEPVPRRIEQRPVPPRRRFETPLENAP